MKKIFTLIALTLLVMQANAQQKWDFSNLTETMAAIATDKTNWEVDKTNAEGVVTQYHYMAIPSSTDEVVSIMCGDKHLAVTDGLLFKGISKTKSFVVSVNTASRHYLKLNAGSLKMIIPNLKKGQTVTIIGRTGSAEIARGFTADENLTVVSGFEVNTEDNQTNVATVNADGDVVIGQTASMNVYSIEVSAAGSEGGGDQSGTTEGTKIWDFANLASTFQLVAADKDNWAVNKTETDGTISEYDNVFKISADEQKPIIYAENGTTKNLPITDGLLFSNARTGNLLFSTHRKTQHYFKLNASDVKLIIPNRKKGDKVTVELEGASTTEARGLNAENITPTSGNFNNPIIGVQTDEGTVTEDGNVILTSTSGVNIFKITVESTTTGIEMMTTKFPNTGATYNMAGQRVTDSYKGVVIRNGKKYMNR